MGATSAHAFGPTQRSGIASGRRVAGAAILLVAISAAAWFLFVRGDAVSVASLKLAASDSAATGAPAPDRVDKGESARSTTKHDKEDAAGTAAEEELAARGDQPVESFEIFASKDPFKPLVTAPAAAGRTGGGRSSRSTGGGLVLSLVDARDRKAHVRVDGTVYGVTVDEIFAGHFKLVSVAGKCAILLYGDDQFVLCKGDEIVK